MKMCSDCSGECCVCASSDGCLAGHGDDCFSFASKEKIIDNLDKGEYPSYTDYMKQTLKIRYGYDYDSDTERVRAVPKPEKEYPHLSFSDFLQFSTDLIYGKNNPDAKTRMDEYRSQF